MTSNAAPQAMIAAVRALSDERDQIHAQITALRKEISQLLARLDIIEGGLSGLNAYLNAHDAPAGAEAQHTIESRSEWAWDSDHNNGVLTQKQAIAQVLKSQAGPLHASALWKAMQELGIRSNADKPINVLDSQILEMRKKYQAPIVNRGRRMYEWVGPRD